MINLPVSNYDQETAQGGSEEKSNIVKLYPEAQAANAIQNTNYEASRSVPHNKYALEESVRNQGGEMADQTREEIDAKIVASEARTDTKVVRLESKLDLVLAKLDSVRDDSRVIRTNQRIIGFGLAGLMVAIVALFPVFFGIGTQVKDMVDHAVDTHLPTTKK